MSGIVESWRAVQEATAARFQHLTPPEEERSLLLLSSSPLLKAPSVSTFPAAPGSPSCLCICGYIHHALDGGKLDISYPWWSSPMGHDLRLGHHTSLSSSLSWVPPAGLWSCDQYSRVSWSKVAKGHHSQKEPSNPPISWPVWCRHGELEMSRKPKQWVCEVVE